MEADQPFVMIWSAWSYIQFLGGGSRDLIVHKESLTQTLMSVSRWLSEHSCVEEIIDETYRETRVQVTFPNRSTYLLFKLTWFKS